MSNKKISILVPCYNEEENLENFHKTILQVFQSLDYELELIFVNDGSKDLTLPKLIELSNKDKKVKVVNLSRNFGKEIALTAAIDNASGDAVIPMDADMQDPPEIVPQLIKKWEEGYDVVYATRALRNGDTFAKKITAKFFYKLITSISKTKIPSNTGDFRLMDKKVVDALKEIKEYHRFMKGIFAWVGFKQTSITYDRKPRFAGKTKFNYWKLIGLAIEGITSFTIAPLRISTVLGFFVSLISFFYAIFIIVKKFALGNDVAGYPSLMVAILFLGGIQLLSIGIIGEYIGRIFNETKNRPLYLIRDRFGF